MRRCIENDNKNYNQRISLIIQKLNDMNVL